jgi:hypothetical protein
MRCFHQILIGFIGLSVPSHVFLSGQLLFSGVTENAQLRRIEVTRYKIKAFGILMKKRKGDFFRKHRAMQGMGGGGIAAYILNLGFRKR